MTCLTDWAPTHVIHHTRRLFCCRLGRVLEALAMGSLGGELQLVPEDGDERIGDLGMGVVHGWSFRGDERPHRAQPRASGVGRDGDYLSRGGGSGGGVRADHVGHGRAEGTTEAVNEGHVHEHRGTSFGSRLVSSMSMIPHPDR
jgi:hypothetical protein